MHGPEKCHGPAVQIMPCFQSIQHFQWLLSAKLFQAFLHRAKIYEAVIDRRLSCAAHSLNSFDVMRVDASCARRS